MSNNATLAASGASQVAVKETAIGAVVAVKQSSITISGGSTFTSNEPVTIDQGAVNQAAVAVSGGSQFNVTASYANTTIKQGSFTLSDKGTSATLAGQLFVGTSGASAKLIVNDGATLTTTSTYPNSTQIGYGDKGNGEVDVNNGGTWNSSGGLIVGAWQGNAQRRARGERKIRRQCRTIAAGRLKGAELSIHPIVQ